jgi:hypothetical protein
MSSTMSIATPQRSWGQPALTGPTLIRPGGDRAALAMRKVAERAVEHDDEEVRDSRISYSPIWSGVLRRNRR